MAEAYLCRVPCRTGGYGPSDMTIIGLHHSHEQIAPSVLLEVARAARGRRVRGGDVLRSLGSLERAPGTTAAQRGRGWVRRCRRRPRCPSASSPRLGQRYHPAITAQAIATLGGVYPRPVLGHARLGRGAGTSTSPATGGPTSRTATSVGPSPTAVIRAAPRRRAGHPPRARPSRVRARLWTRPAVQPELFGAAVSTASASRAGSLGRRPGHPLATTGERPWRTCSTPSAAPAARAAGPVYVQVHV